jgi:glycosyltransferase involved in cell wall biosynthesis
MKTDSNVTVGLGVATFGQGVYDEWALRGAKTLERNKAGFDQAVHIHASSLASARNEVIDLLETEWIVLLDADDDLMPGYAEAVRRGAESGHLLQVKTIGRVDGLLETEAVYIPRSNMWDRNYLIIGTVFEKKFAPQFTGLPILEDWEFWMRMISAGHDVKQIDATYIVDVNNTGRNSDAKTHAYVYNEIRKQFEPYRQILSSHTLRELEPEKTSSS